MSAIESHAAHGDHEHKHHVSSWQFLTGVLVTLLILTVVTVGASRIDLGGGLNLALALAIACVKAGLVCAFFMHLAHDKPFNTVILFYCLLAVGCFMLFTVIDLGSRDRVDPVRSGTVVDPPMAAQARENYIAEHGYDPVTDGHGHGDDH
ncbi:MAG: cytochrome C oxidase subunit IV family protein [Phycisphaerales bacterium]